MRLAKRLLLQLYYHSTRPLRWWQQRRMLETRGVPIAVLFYHRVADDEACEWTLSNQTFVEQVRWLREHVELISLAEVQRRVRSGSNDRPAVAITFDDGYADNCQQAIPFLVEQGVPCTYFVTLYNVLAGQPFAHDLLCENYFAPNTVEQLREMAEAGIEIGAHTFTHADLGQIHDPRILRSEVIAAGEELAQLVDRPVRYFAFPFGRRENLNPQVFQMLRRAGYAGVCSAYGGFNFPGDDAFHIQRIGAPNSLIGLVNHLTGDPRKLYVPRYDYSAAAGEAQSEGKVEAPEQEAVVSGSRSS